MRRIQALGPGTAPFQPKLLRAALLLLATLLMALQAACGPSGSDQVLLSELPDPLIYALAPAELPEVGLPWQRAYDQSTNAQGYRWAYQAYQAYQPGGPGSELEAGFAVNTDIYLYELDVSHEDLPQPPNELGSLQGVSWKSVTPQRRLGDKTAVWKTSLGDLATPVWWLEFYQGHAYVRLSLLGFPDQIAPAILYGLGDILAGRLPKSTERLRADAATPAPTPPPTRSPALTLQAPLPSATPLPAAVTPAAAVSGIIPQSYSAPPGETGMLTFFDDTGRQLTDGVRGSDDILADLGSGSGYEWVGWTNATEPITLTFTFSAPVNLSAVQIGMYHREGLGIFVPQKVTINGQAFELAADAVPDNHRGDIVIKGPFSGSTIELVIYHRGRGWVMLDEVAFLP